jgi:hypothetical protein
MGLGLRVEMKLKVCTKCNILKPLDEFHKLKANRDGRTGGCKKCLNARLRELAAQPDQRAKKNYMKRDRLQQPFQPSLSMGVAS